MLIQSNALRIPLRDKSVQCVVTSPPYYGLRDYGVSGQLGLEPTLQEYIENTVKWCREVRRVLRNDGTFWLNMGDSYNGSGGPGSQYDNKHASGLKGEFKKYDNPNKKQVGFKNKDLMMVPHRVAIALQDDGWWVRGDIVWHKPNPMPESVTDRPTKSHEYIFLLTKSKKYYYDADAIREVLAKSTLNDRRDNGTRNKGTWAESQDSNVQGSFMAFNPSGRNKRTVWTVTTKAYKKAHFATFPPEIPETCIKAGTSEKGACPVCGNGWVRETEVTKRYIAGGTPRASEADIKHFLKTHGTTHHSRDGLTQSEKKTIGWKPTCDHNEEPVPAIVADIFCGSGTTIMVANALGRKGIGIDLSWDYLQLARERTGVKALEEWVEGKKAESNLDGLPMFDLI